MKKILLILVAFLIWDVVYADSLLIKDINLVDPETETIREGVDIYIDDSGKIEWVGPNIDLVRWGQTADVVLDCDGQYVIPGLMDLHAHPSALKGPKGGMSIPLDFPTSSYMMLYTGVTTVLDMVSFQEQVIFGISQTRNKIEYRSLRDAQRHYGYTNDIWRDYKTPPQWPYLPDIYTTGAILTPDWQHGTEYGVYTRTVNTERQAEAEVLALSTKGNDEVKGIDAIKIVYGANGLPINNAHAAINAGHNLDEPISTIAHINSWASVPSLINPDVAIVDAVTHARTDPVQTSTISLMVENNVAWIPTHTLSVEHENVCWGQGPLGVFLNDPLIKQTIRHELLEQFRAKEFCPVSNQIWNKLQANYQKIKYGGVNILVGTDIPNRGTFSGFSVHREMIIMVNWDWTSNPVADKNWYALRAATTAPGKFLAKSSPYAAANDISYGVHTGDVGNLVILNANPIKNIKNTQKISDVIYRGTVVDRTGLRDQFCTTGTAPGQCVDPVPASSCRIE